MKNLTITSAYMSFGAVLFWLPDIIFNARVEFASSSTQIRLLTFLLPLITVLGYLIMRWIARSSTKGPSIAGFMVLGIWVAGPLATMIGATFHGGGFSTPGTWPFVIVATLLFPVFTFMMATYDGTLGALFLSSLFLTVMHILFEKAYWILPPLVWDRVKRAFGLSWAACA